MDTQVYATIHYPTRMVGLGYPAAAYHTLEIVPNHAPALPPPYIMYYLHLDTYVGQNKSRSTIQIRCRDAPRPCTCRWKRVRTFRQDA